MWISELDQQIVFKMLTINQIECDNKKQATRIEGLMYDEMGASLNTQKPGRTQKEWQTQNYEENREAMLEKDKKIS